MRAISMLLVFLFACADDEVQPPPTCESLGCDGLALCNSLGECKCNGEACVQCERTDAGVCTED